MQGGILPSKTGTGVEQNYVIDGSQDANDIINSAEQAGTAGGNVLADATATADSANTAVTELSGTVGGATGGVGRVEASGPGWSAVRAGSVCMITFDVELVMSLSAKPVLPDVFKPAQTIYLPVGDGLVTITEEGTVTYPGGSGKATHLYLI